MNTLLAKTHTALSSAELLLSTNDCDGGVNQSFYGCHDAARVVLKLIGQVDCSQIKTHAGLIGTLSMVVIKTDLLLREVGALLGREQDMRMLAYCGDAGADPAMTKSAVEQAKVFVNAFANLLSRYPGPPAS
jgi:uncharacterized protein (UPF0332 family)